MGFNDKKITSVSENEKFDNLNNMGIHWTSLKTWVQNNLQNWKILKIGQIMAKNRFFLWINFTITKKMSFLTLLSQMLIFFDSVNWFELRNSIRF